MRYGRNIVRDKVFGSVGLFLFLSVAVPAGIVGLWYAQMVELPAPLVHSAGRVAGMVKSVGSMDVELPVPLHYQEHSLSCEVATLKMALGHYGVDVPESELIRRLPFDATSQQGGIWGDPDVGFVGDIDGHMMVTGYGVYWDPIARLGSAWKRTEVLRGGSLSDIALHIAASRPVIMWGNYGRPVLHHWNTTAGKPVTAVRGEHTRLVAGFRGPVNAPTHFLLLDPIYGRLEVVGTDLSL